MARDNYRCFLSGGLDRSVYFDDMPLPAGVTGTVRCCTVSIIPPEVLAHPDASQDLNAQPDSDQVRCGTSTSGVLSSYVHVVPVPIQHTPPEEDVMLGILKRFFGVDTTTLAEQAYAPANTLLMHGWAADAFTMFLWWLLPTEVRFHFRFSLS